MITNRHDIKGNNECDCDEDNTCGCTFPNNTLAAEPTKLEDNDICLCDDKGDCDCHEE